MNRSLITTLVLLGTFGGFALGVRWGFDEGIRHAAFLDAPARGSWNAAQLRALRAGQIDRVIAGLESDIDYRVLDYHAFLEEGHPVLLTEAHERIVAGAPDAMRRIADYRRAYPRPRTPDLDETADGEDVRQLNHYLNEARRTNRAIVDSMLQKYSDR